MKKQPKSICQFIDMAEPPNEGPCNLCYTSPIITVGSADFGDGSKEDIHTCHWECTKCGKACGILEEKDCFCGGKIKKGTHHSASEEQDWEKEFENRYAMFRGNKDIFKDFIASEKQKSYLEGWNDCGEAVTKELKKYT